MKTSIWACLLMALILAGGSASAQSRGGARAAFEKGDNTLGFSVGVGAAHAYRGGTTYLPAFAVNFDHGLVGNVGPGTIGIGGIVSWQSSYYRFGNGDRDVWANFHIGVRGTYHLTLLKEKNNKFDPYAGATLGIRAESFRTDRGNAGNSYGGAYPFFGPFIGAKYNFTPKFGAFSELGFDVSIFRIGLHLNI
jgi:hypothetical protein